MPAKSDPNNKRGGAANNNNKGQNNNRPPPSSSGGGQHYQPGAANKRGASSNARGGGTSVRHHHHHGDDSGRGSHQGPYQPSPLPPYSAYPPHHGYAPPPQHYPPAAPPPPPPQYAAPYYPPGQPYSYPQQPHPQQAYPTGPHPGHPPQPHPMNPQPHPENPPSYEQSVRHEKFATGFQAKKGPRKSAKKEQESSGEDDSGESDEVATNKGKKGQGRPQRGGRGGNMPRQGRPLSQEVQDNTISARQLIELGKRLAERDAMQGDARGSRPAKREGAGGDQGEGRDADKGGPRGAEASSNKGAPDDGTTVTLKKSISDCKWFMIGRCFKPFDKCLYRHYAPARTATVVCPAWKERKCRDWECKLRHNEFDLQVPTTPVSSVPTAEAQPASTAAEELGKNGDGSSDQSEESETSTTSTTKKEKRQRKKKNKPGRKERARPDENSATETPRSSGSDDHSWMLVFVESKKGVAHFSCMELPLEALVDDAMDLSKLPPPYPSEQAVLCHSFQSEGVCPEASCSMVHCSRPYLWQASQDGSLWVNLKDHQDSHMEHHFTQVSVNMQKLPPLVHATPNIDPLKSLLKNFEWEADYGKMVLRSPDQPELKLRRLTSAHPSNWRWYHSSSNNDEWEMYPPRDGCKLEAAFKKDPAGQVHLDYPDRVVYLNMMDQVTSGDLLGSVAVRRRPLPSTRVQWEFKDGSRWVEFTDSEKIEKDFVKHPSGMMHHEGGESGSIIDFTKLKETDMATRQVRDVRRTEVGTSGPKQEVRRPSHWKDTDGGLQLIPLNSNSSEYKEVASKFEDEPIESISRIQNEETLHQYERKRRLFKLDELSLYHGASLQHLPAVVSHNLCELTPGLSMYGYGMYFSASPKYAEGCCPGMDNPRVVLQCKVLIGEKIQGTLDMKKPPDNKLTGHQYDTTVDYPQTPKVFVKFYDDTFYPEYVIKLKP